MKKFIRDIMEDLKHSGTKDFVPEPPAAPTDGKTTDLTPPPAETTPQDLDNQVLSEDNAELVKQLDYQAHKSEVLQTS